MKKLTLMIAAVLALALIDARADECQNHTAYATTGTVTAGTGNGMSVPFGVVGYAFFNPYVCTTNGVAFVIQTADSSTSNSYGFALVGVNGNATAGRVYAYTTPVNGPGFTGAGAKNVQSLPWSAGPTPLLVGTYMLTLGTTCSTAPCAALYGDSTLGQFYPFIYADTAANTPWAFTSAGFDFSKFSAGVVAVSIPLSTTALQNITGTTATVTLSTLIVGHIYVGATISVQGVTTGGGGTGLNCVSCTVTSIAHWRGVVKYTVPSGSFNGTVNSGATLSVSPVLVQQVGFVAPTVLIY